MESLMLQISGGVDEKADNVRAPYDFIISLGGNCEVAYHIRRRFSLESAHIFDWWITPFAGLIELVNHDFEGLLSSEMLRRDRVAIFCERYGIHHHHDFDRDADAWVILDRVDAQIPALNTKYAALAARLKVACDKKRVLFVRSWREILHEGPDYPKHAPHAVPDFPFTDLINALEKRFSTCDFDVLFVNYGVQFIEHPRAMFYNVRDYRDGGWAGSPAGWDDMFKRLGVHLVSNMPLSAATSCRMREKRP